MPPFCVVLITSFTYGQTDGALFVTRVLDTAQAQRTVASTAFPVLISASY